MSRNQIEQINHGWATIEDATKFFSRSFRNPLIGQRAAKHFGRKVREGKVHENFITNIFQKGSVNNESLFYAVS